jgi:ATP-dependent helicase/nuclease subunit B
VKKVYYTPHTESVDQFLFSYISEQLKRDTGFKVLHLTPTLILYRKRRNEYQKQFMRSARRNRIEFDQELIHKHICLNEFHHWTKDYLYKEKKAYPLSRSESHILVKRSIVELYPDNREWLSVSRNLVELFSYLNSTNLNIEETMQISQYKDWKKMIEVYQHYNETLKTSGLEDYSQCLVRTLNEDQRLEQYSEVIFDGPFLFFDPIHEVVMKKFSSLGKPVKFIVPYERTNFDVNPSYKVIQKVYSNYVNESEWERIPSQRGNSYYLEKVPSLLFTDQSTNHDGSLTINRYSSLEQELNDVLKQVKRLVTEENVSQNKIAIVTPNSMEIRPVVREISENIGLNVEVPERSFLGLSVGEFIRLIYLIKNDDRKFDDDSYLDSSMFKRILDSKWIKDSQKTLHSFQYVEEGFFSNVTSLQEWENQFNRLLAIKQKLGDENLPYHPLHPVSKNDIVCWLNVIDEIKSIQAKVFSLQEGSIAEHARFLLETLEPLLDQCEWNDEDFQDDSNESADLIQRMTNILIGMSSQDRIKMAASEFGDIVLSLFEEKEEEQEELKVIKEEKTNKGIMVTNQQNIAYQNYKYIFAIEFTQENYPNPEKSQWPLHTDIMWKLLNKTTSLKVQSSLELERLYADREKYYFYLSFLSTSSGYHISYSKTKHGSTLYPSHYLHDIAKTIGMEEKYSEDKSEKPKSIEDLLEEHGILKSINYFQDVIPEVDELSSEDPNTFTIPTKLTLDELGIYQVCPKRFSYMNKYQCENVYSNSFQLSFYIATELFIRGAKNLINELQGQKLVEVFESNSLRGNLMRSIPNYIHTENQLFDYFPVNNEMKESAIYNARLFLENLIEQLLHSEVIKSIKAKGNAHAAVSLEANEKAGQVEIQTDNSQFVVHATREVSSQIGFNPRRTFSFTHRPHMLGSSFYDVEYNLSSKQESVIDWLNRLKREFFYIEKQDYVKTAIQEVLKDMENSSFPKRKGAHCNYCPFHNVCLENQTLTTHE